MLHGRTLFLLTSFLVCALSACDGSSTSALAPTPPPSPSVLKAPTFINLYPVNSEEDGARLFVFVRKIGSLPLASPVPLAFDTGSAGMTLYAPGVFPDSAAACFPGMETPCGFAFPAGQESITVDNVTVTNVKATRCYGGASGHAQTGNLGFATVTFGDSAGVLTTSTMPILFYFKISTNPATPANPTLCDDSGTTVSPIQSQQGWFGVNTHADRIVIADVSGSGQYPLCDPSSVSTCSVVSVLKYLQFDGIDAGFLVSPSTLQSCTIVSGSCPPKPMLTVGLTTTQTTGFNSMGHLSCSTAAPPLQGFPACNPNIATTSVTVSAMDGSTTISYPNSETLFDSGTPTMILFPTNGVILPTATNPSTGDTIVAANQNVRITLSSGYEYSYSPTAEGLDEAIVNPGGIGNNIVGIDFFQNHALYIDFTTSMEGWR